MGEPMTIDDVRAAMASWCLPAAQAAQLRALLDDHARLAACDEGEHHEITRLRAEVERLTQERDEARTEEQATRARWQSSLVSLRTGTLERERDRLAAALAEVREAADALVECVDAIDGDALRYGLGPALDAADTVRNLASIPADLADAHDARVRAEALREAAPRVGKECRSGHEAETWLRAEAERVGGGR